MRCWCALCVCWLSDAYHDAGTCACNTCSMMRTCTYTACCMLCVCMFHFACCMLLLHSVCCMLYVACCICRMYVACLYVAYFMLHVACCMLHVHVVLHVYVHVACMYSHPSPLRLAPRIHPPASIRHHHHTPHTYIITCTSCHATTCTCT